MSGTPDERAAIVAAYHAAAHAHPSVARGSVGCAVAVLGLVAIPLAALMARISTSVAAVGSAFGILMVAGGLVAHVVGSIRRSTARAAAMDAAIAGASAAADPVDAGSLGHIAAVLVLAWETDGPSARRYIEPDELRRRLGPAAAVVERVEAVLAEELPGYWPVLLPLRTE